MARRRRIRPTTWVGLIFLILAAVAAVWLVSSFWDTIRRLFKLDPGDYRERDVDKLVEELRQDGIGDGQPGNPFANADPVEMANYILARAAGLGRALGTWYGKTNPRNWFVSPFDLFQNLDEIPNMATFAYVARAYNTQEKTKGRDLYADMEQYAPDVILNLPHTREIMQR